MNGAFQNTKRLAAVIDAIAANSHLGMRQVDLVNATGLNKGTIHRILSGLVSCDLVALDESTSRYFIGPKIVSWSRAGQLQSSLVDQLRPILASICDTLGDTVYLTLKHGNRATYIERFIGSYPLKALPREVGEQRPLGIGAGPLAILAGLDPEAFEATLNEIKPDLKSFGMREHTLRELVKRSQSLGYALHTGEIQEGMVAIGLPLRKGPSIVGAISVAATGQRLTEVKRPVAAQLIRDRILSSGLDLTCNIEPRA